MQIRIKSKTAIAIVLTLLMASIVLLPAFAQLSSYNSTRHWYPPPDPTNVQPNGSQISIPAGVTPDVTVAPDAYLSFRPNPVGVGQPILVNIWLDPGPAVTRYLTGYKVTLTKPDGTTDTKTVNSYQADSTAWFEYIVDQVGTWTLKFDFPGGYFPAGNYTMPPGSGTAYDNYTESYERSVYYASASTDEQTLTVQDAQVYSWPPIPLPTNYWTRPVPFENREWATIAGNYPWHGPGTSSDWPADTNRYWNDRYTFVPYVQAPNTAHIVWKRVGDTTAGIMGGDNVCVGDQGSGGNPSIIYEGYAYQSVTKPFNGETQSVWQKYDIRTGEVMWERAGDSVPSAPSYIEYTTGSESVPGAEASVGISVSLIAISRGYLYKYDPNTGSLTGNYSLDPLSSATYYMNGYALSVQRLGSEYRLINWTTIGNLANLTTSSGTRIISNISWPRSDLAQFQDFSSGMAFNAREPNVPLTLGQYPFVNLLYDNATGFRHGMTIEGYSLVTGEVLYNYTVDDTPIIAAEAPYGPSNAVADHGRFVVLMRDGTFNVYDQSSGKMLFKTERMDYPWDAPGFGAYASASAYGLFYRFAYSGIYAFDWDTGKIVWKYEAPALSEYETPYVDPNGTTVYSFNAGSTIADGKLYCYNTEHTPTQPITRGWGIHCMNATTGEFIWKMETPGSSVVADGYLSVSSSDGIQYVYGKGKSATTVSAPQTAITQGQSIVLTGSVLDLSPAQPGTPCVSKDSMTTQMQYLHKQQPIDGIWHNETITGVPVSLDAVDPQGTFVHIGDTVTDGYSGTFGFMWKPDGTGKYSVTATFMGDDSYGGSFATTTVGVVEAPETPTPTEPEQSPDNTMLLYGILVAVIIAIVLAIIALVVIFRKK